MKENKENYTVYVLRSLSGNQIYIGFTSNMQNRLRSHNSPNNRGYTKKYKPWEIVYKEQFRLKKIALKREKQLKSYRGREFIRKIILGD